MSNRFRWQGSLGALSPADRSALRNRSTSANAEVRTRTATILERVRTAGDVALHELALELNGVALAELAVPRAARVLALDTLDASVRRALEHAMANIETVHRSFLPSVSELEVEPGVIVGRRPDALDSVGVYAPGGRAAYPSSVLMGVVPARVAGVGEIVLCSPPGAGRAAVAGGARRGGAGGCRPGLRASAAPGAIAAMAYGTASVPGRPHRRAGQRVRRGGEAAGAGGSAIDSPAGPSELLVIADDSADPTLVARELLAQAEHDPRAAVVALVRGERAAETIVRALERARADSRGATSSRRALAARRRAAVADSSARRSHSRTSTRPSTPARASRRRAARWRGCATRARCSSGDAARSRSATT